MEQIREQDRVTMTLKKINEITWKGKQIYNATEHTDPQAKAPLGLGFKQIKYTDLYLDEIGMFPVSIGQIINLGRFWLCTNEESVVSAFTNLIKEMKEFYREAGDDWKLVESDFVIGLPIAFPLATEDIFYRGIIYGDMEELEIKVFVPDYGSFHRIPKELVRYLSVKYLEFPTLALPAKLCAVKPWPLSQVWTQESTIYFCELTTGNRYLQANLNYTHNGVLNVVLIDLQDSELTLYVKMITEGHAAPMEAEVIISEFYAREIYSRAINYPEGDGEDEEGEEKEVVARPATRSEIDQNTSSYTQPDNKSLSKCSICLLEFSAGEDLRRLQCKHFFHVECVDTWFAINCNCPMCRTPIHERPS